MKIIALFITCLFFVNTYSQNITNYTTTNGLLDNYVECIDIDINDNIWVGTLNGVQMYDGVNWVTYNQATFPGLLSDNIKCIKATSNGQVWVGTDYGANQLISGVSGYMWIPYTTTNGLNSNQVKSIDEDVNGEIWIGTNQGVSHYDGASWVTYSSPDLHWSGVNSTDFDSNGDKWFSSPLGGITHFDGASFTTYNTSIGLLSQNTTKIIIDNLDNKWIGSGSGISVLNNTNNYVTNYTKMYLMPPPDTLNPVVDLSIDSYNNLWVAIYVGYLGEGGVAMYDGSNWIDYDVSDGLVGKNIKGLSIDSQDNVWVATTSGVSKISTTITNINKYNNQKLIVYPNPSKDMINIAIESEPNIVTDINIYNIMGQKLSNHTLKNNKTSLDISSLKKGVYYIRTNNKAYSLSKNFIVK
jgi:hypothetical protein